MVRALASAVQGLGIIIGITAGVPWLLMPNDADWAGLGFGTVLVAALLMIGLGGAIRLLTAMERPTRRAGAAPQVVIVTPRRRRKT